MTLLEAIVLGVLQGLTEFLPVSSSGHLVLMQHFLGLREPQVFFDVMLHLGTLGAVVIVYHRAIGRLALAGGQTLGDVDFYRHPVRTVRTSPELALIGLLVLGSIPTGLIAVLFKDSLESIFARPRIVAVMLVVTGLVLNLPRLRGTQKPSDLPLKGWHAVLIGVAQGLAITPGISRSGATISVALLLGMGSETAAQYSFLLSIPAILGAVGLKLTDVTEVTVPPHIVATGTLVSFVIGYVALRLLLVTLHRGKFSTFSYYCFALGALVLIGMALG